MPRLATGDIEPWAQKIIASLNSYTEISPRRCGVHIWVKGSLPPGGRKKGHIEMYCTGRYLTVTGLHLDGTPKTVEERQTEITDLQLKLGRGSPRVPQRLALSQQRTPCPTTN